MTLLNRAVIAGRVRAFDAKLVPWKPPAAPLPSPVVHPEPEMVPETAPDELPHASRWLPVRMPVKLHPSIEDIQRAVCRGTKLTRNHLLSALRLAPIVLQRQISMFLASELAFKSFTEIGRRHGNRDHTTAIHACRKITAMIAADPAFAEKVDQLRSEIMKPFQGGGE